MNDALLIFTKIENKIGNRKEPFLSQPGRKILIHICAGYSPFLPDGPPNIPKKATPLSKVVPMRVPTTRTREREREIPREKIMNPIWRPVGGLGITDLKTQMRDFQPHTGWRFLLINPDALWVKILTLKHLWKLDLPAKLKRLIPLEGALGRPSNRT